MMEAEQAGMMIGEKEEGSQEEQEEKFLSKPNGSGWDVSRE